MLHDVPLLTYWGCFFLGRMCGVGEKNWEKIEKMLSFLLKK